MASTRSRVDGWASGRSRSSGRAVRNASAAMRQRRTRSSRATSVPSDGGAVSVVRMSVENPANRRLTARSALATCLCSYVHSSTYPHRCFKPAHLHSFQDTTAPAQPSPPLTRHMSWPRGLQQPAAGSPPALGSAPQTRCPTGGGATRRSPGLANEMLTAS